MIAKLFSIIIPLFDPFDRMTPAGAVQSSLGKALNLEGDFELIVVNNNPLALCPQLRQYLRALSESNPKVKFVEPNACLGTARGFNAGLRVAALDSAYLVFMAIDADIVDPRMLRKIQQVLDSAPRIGIAHPVSVFEDADEFNFSPKYSSDVFYRMIRQHCSPESAEISATELQQILKVVSSRQGIKAPIRSTPLTFAIYRREMFQQIGPFDEGVEGSCHETDDLSYRALLAGYTVARLNGVFVNHRRLLFRTFVVEGTPESETMPHSEELKQSTAWWDQKWGKPYVELYARWRWGGGLFTLMLPYFWLRRLAVFIKKMVQNIH